MRHASKGSTSVDRSIEHQAAWRPVYLIVCLLSTFLPTAPSAPLSPLITIDSYLQYA